MNQDLSGSGNHVDPAELLERRLEVDARRTERFLRQAGIVESMRVLDVGCGTGRVSMIVAGLVGEDGAVVGVDRNGGAIATARETALRLGAENATFHEGDFRDVLDRPAHFDAVVGRRVLMYLEDPGDALRRMTPSVKPGGLLMFEEVDFSVPPTGTGELPLHRAVHNWVGKALAHAGATTSMGLDLYRVFEAAGLKEPSVHAEAILQTPTVGYSMTPVVRILLPKILQCGVATESEVDIRTLEARLVDERRAARTAFVHQLVFVAWARWNPDQRDAPA